jgi:hypothetical protein
MLRDQDPKLYTDFLQGLNTAKGATGKKKETEGGDTQGQGGGGDTNAGGSASSEPSKAEKKASNLVTEALVLDRKRRWDQLCKEDKEVIEGEELLAKLQTELGKNGSLDEKLAAAGRGEDMVKLTNLRSRKTALLEQVGLDRGPEHTLRLLAKEGSEVGTVRAGPAPQGSGSTGSADPGVTQGQGFPYHLYPPAVFMQGPPPQVPPQVAAYFAQFQLPGAMQPQVAAGGGGTTAYGTPASVPSTSPKAAAQALAS